VMMRWGLVPSWAKDATGGAAMINAKAETVTEKSAYRKAFVSRPCLVPADGFYEWAKIGPKEKQPYFITTRNQEPFAFAGLWEWWRAKDAARDTPALETFTILTTEPNAMCAPIHNRMPVMLAQDDSTRWLESVEERQSILSRASFPAERMDCWPVGQAVGNVRNDGAQLIERMAA